jgi:hypothetical protein
VGVDPVGHLAQADGVALVAVPDRVDPAAVAHRVGEAGQVGGLIAP